MDVPTCQLCGVHPGEYHRAWCRVGSRWELDWGRARLTLCALLALVLLVMLR